MDSPDGHVPAPRASTPGRFRRLPTAAELSDLAPGEGLLPGEDAPRVADLHSLLGDIDALRLTLQTDLTLAAAALEGGAQDLAAELVDSDLAEVRAFAGRAAGHLARLDAASEDEVPASQPVRRRRILSGAPLMAAAAALIGFVAFVPSRGAASPETSMTSAAMAGFELSRLVSEGAPEEQLRRAAEELNDELAVLIAQAGDDPEAREQALLLLEKTTEVLSRQGDSSALRSVIAETQALRARLRETAQTVTRPARTVVRPLTPVLPRVQIEPEKERGSSPAPKSSPKPSPKPSPSAAPPPPSPQPEPSPEASPRGSEEPEGPLPQPGGLPGV